MPIQLFESYKTQHIRFQLIYQTAFYSPNQIKSLEYSLHLDFKKFESYTNWYGNHQSILEYVPHDKRMVAYKIGKSKQIDDENVTNAFIWRVNVYTWCSTSIKQWKTLDSPSPAKTKRKKTNFKIDR